MMALDIPPDGLSAFLSLLRHSPSLIGCSVTYPHKQAAFEAVDCRTDRAARLGALNTIRRDENGGLTGDATDGAAMCMAIAAKGGKIKGARARILGAGGGAGQAIADALCTAGLAQIALDDNDTKRQAQVAQILRRHWPQVEQVSTGVPADILVNATTLGNTATDICPFNTVAIARATIICDVVTGGGPSPLVCEAIRQGKVTVTGADMGAGQLPTQLDFLGLSA